MGRRSARDQERVFVLEGRRSIAEAMSAGASIETVYVDVSAAAQADVELVAAARSAGVPVTEVEPGVLARACDTVSPQPVAATVRSIDIGLDELGLRGPHLVAVLAGVGDPGNAGSILRSLAAAGGGAAVLCAGSVDLYNPKTVRSSAGAILRVPVVRDAPVDRVAGELRDLGFTVVAASASGGRAHTDLDLSGRVAILLGNEAHGLPPGLAEAAGATVSIPMAGGAESLGVAAAGAVIFFEAARQRARGSVAGGVERVAGAA